MIPLLTIFWYLAIQEIYFLLLNSKKYSASKTMIPFTKIITHFLHANGSFRKFYVDPFLQMDGFELNFLCIHFHKDQGFY